MPAIDELTQAEIVALHQFFQDYFTGAIEPDAIARFETSMDDTFTIIAADGRVTDYATITNIIRNAYNRQRNFRIWIENVIVRQHVGNIIVATYEEWQQVEATITSRVSTVMFHYQPQAATHQQLTWLHVHESGLKTVAS